MPQLVLELFSEEIPARMQAGAARDLERMFPGGVETFFTTPAQFVKSDGQERTKQREAGSEGEEDRHHVVAETQTGEEKPGDGIDHAEQNDMGWHRQKVVDAPGDCVLQIRKSNFADNKICRGASGAIKNMESSHIYASVNRSPKDRGAPGNAQRHGGTGHAVAATCRW